GTAAVTVTTPTATKPGMVTDLAVSGASDTSVTLAFMDVTDGTGLPASYLVRFAVAPLDWATASDVAMGTCRVPMAGVAIGTNRSCTVLDRKRVVEGQREVGGVGARLSDDGQCV